MTTDPVTAGPSDAGGQMPAGIVVGVYPTSGVAHEHGLVVLAMGLDYDAVSRDDGTTELLVPETHLADVRRQLELYARESAHWPPRPPPPVPRVSGALVTPCIWFLVTALAFREQMLAPGVWEARGALDPVALFRGGEGWRPFTALFLHGDLGHLVSNLGGGLLVFGSVLATFGLRRGWLLLGAAAVVGNLLTAAAHGVDGGYRSLGASTAVFAGIGLLTGAAVRAALRGEGSAWRVRRLLMPAAAGVVLLAWLGAGGTRTDVLAHAMGFVCGLVAGGSVSIGSATRREKGLSDTHVARDRPPIDRPPER
jgi:membrane associated rhomboid family serine protease